MKNRLKKSLSKWIDFSLTCLITYNLLHLIVAYLSLYSQSEVKEIMNH